MKEFYKFQKKKKRKKERKTISRVFYKYIYTQINCDKFMTMRTNLQKGQNQLSECKFSGI